MAAKKMSKSKEKKMQRKENLAALGESQMRLNKANLPTNDHLGPFKPFQKYTRNGLELSIECTHFANLAEADFESIFTLLETNMKKEYEASDWGWNGKEKKAELREKNPWFLIARDATSKVIAFAHFKFDFDEEEEVLYCYEVQVVDEMRSKGVGKFMMQILELIGSTACMKKMMVTVFKHNSRSIHFFKDVLKYTDDETSPRYCDPLEESEYCYEIMSKPLKARNTDTGNAKAPVVQKCCQKC